MAHWTPKEIDGTEIICHGEDEDGADGEQGPQGEQGETGAQGEQGVPGEAGADAEPCTAVDNGDGTYTITCPDGTSVTLSDGSQGPQGEQGEQGAAGADGEGCSATDNGMALTPSNVQMGRALSPMVLMARQGGWAKCLSLVLLPPMTQAMW